MRILGMLIVIVLVLLAVAWVVGDGMANGGMKRAGDEQWPSGLGTLASLESRLPKRETNDAARRLTELAPAVDITFAKGGEPSTPMKKAIGEYEVAQHRRAERAIEPPPAEVSAFLASHEAQIDALRDQLLQHDLVWDLDVSNGFAAPIPNLLAHMHIARLLTARAYARGAANDARAWEDLRATARLGRSLEPRPELISQLIGLAIVRMVNAAAWKMPVADVPWLAELHAVDHRRLMMGAFQYETWMMWRHGEDETKSWKARIGKPYTRWSIADMTRRQHARSLKRSRRARRAARTLPQSRSRAGTRSVRSPRRISILSGSAYFAASPNARAPRTRCASCAASRSSRRRNAATARGNTKVGSWDSRPSCRSVRRRSRCR